MGCLENYEKKHKQMYPRLIIEDTSKKTDTALEIITSIKQYHLY